MKEILEERNFFACSDHRSRTPRFHCKMQQVLET
jgi:hypothetical protein